MALATRPKPTIQHRKRQAQHHRQNKHYLKTYWPYLPMLLIVVVGLAINSALYNTHVLGSKSDFSAATLLSGTNQMRAKHQETALTLNSQLSSAAQAKANDMAAKDYWAHTSPDGQSPWSFIIASGYQYQAAGENLAYGFNDASGVIAGWMNSTEHRNNLLNTNYTDVGFGVANAADYQGKGPETIVVAEYGAPANGTSLGAQTATLADANLPAHSISRLAVLTDGQAAWSVAALSALTGACLMLFIVRHGFRIKRALNHGEAFIVHHPYIDIAIVFVVMAGYVLTRSNGIIH